MADKQLILFYYQAVSGYHMPQIHKGSQNDLMAKYKLSVTPVVGIVHLSNATDRLNARIMLEAQLTTTPEKETGLRFNLETCIAALK